MAGKKILWLCSWYPNKLTPFNGDFIKRHAEAASLYDDINVIHVIRDIKGVITKDSISEEYERNGLKEKVIYYYSPKSGISIIDKYRYEKKFRKVFREAIEELIQNSGLPDIAHVHVGLKAGTIAMWLKKKKGIPYVISEHWSGFLPEADEKISDQPVYIRQLWKKVIEGAHAISAVSQHLANSIQQKFTVKKIMIIPNVVDRSVFFPAESPSGLIRFIHISGLEVLKNPSAIMNAFTIVIKSFPDAVLDIFGPDDEKLKRMAVELHAEKNIHFHKEVPQSQLAEFVRQSTALILFSSYETFGCVIIEAHACGIPVIVSDIPVFHETVKEGVNGLFVKPGDINALAGKMIEMIRTRSLFDNKAIAATSEKYNYEKVGKKFSGWYDELLSEIN